MLRAVALVVVLGVVATLTAPAGADPHHRGPDPGPVTYVHPVDAEVVDPFRPPATRFGPGNRGLTYATEPGAPVRAAAPGVVVFAGQVGGSLHVTIAHADGRLTSYSGVAAIGVRLHQTVERGDPIARSRGELHVGVREDGEYVDPASIFGHAVVGARLVPESPIGPPGALGAVDVVELARVARRLGGGPSLLDRVGGFVGRVGGAAGGVVERGFGLLSAGRDLLASGWHLVSTHGPALVGAAWRVAPYVLARRHPILTGVMFLVVLPLVEGEVPPILMFGADLLMSWPRIVERVAVWWVNRQHCTPGDAEPPAATGRRVAVLVGGLDSTSEHAAIGRLDTEALGYSADHVVGFSYAGGRTPGRFGEAATPLADELADIPVSEYDRGHSSAGLPERGALLADLLTEIAERAPDAHIDLYGHSQGGLVARHALAVLQSREGGREVIERLGLVATIASPHDGADLASVATTLAGPLDRSAALRTLGRLLGVTTHPRGTNLPDLARYSDHIEGLQAADLPEGPTYLSLAARGDLFVTDARSRLTGRHVTLPGISPDIHSEVVHQPATTRELSLALGGLPPTCEGIWDLFGDILATEAAQFLASAAGLAAAFWTLPIAPHDIYEPIVRW